MRFLLTLIPYLCITTGLVIRDAPSYVKIKGVSLLGSGCPAGSADVQVDATGSLFEATFSEYEVETGPGTRPVDWRKNCKLTLNMEFESGFQYVSPIWHGSINVPVSNVPDLPSSRPT